MEDPDPIPRLTRLDLSGTGGYLNRGSWSVATVERHRLVLAAEPTAQAEARVALRHWLAHVPAAQRDDVVLLASELVSNAVRHVPGAADRTIELHLASAPTVLRVEVCDGGPPFLPRLRASGPTGGFGLLLVDRIAARWGAAPDAPSCIWFEVAVPVPADGVTAA